MQLAAAGRIGATKYIFAFLLKKNVNSVHGSRVVHWNGDNHIWEVYRRIYVRKSRITAPLTRRRRTKFPTVHPTIYLPKYFLNIKIFVYLFVSGRFTGMFYCNSSRSEYVFRSSSIISCILPSLFAHTQEIHFPGTGYTCFPSLIPMFISAFCQICRKDQSFQKNN